MYVQYVCGTLRTRVRYYDQDTCIPVAPCPCAAADHRFWIRPGSYVMSAHGKKSRRYIESKARSPGNPGVCKCGTGNPLKREREESAKKRSKEEGSKVGN